MAGRRGLIAAALAFVCLGMCAVRPVEAANSWTISLSPMALTQGVPTDVKVTVNDVGQPIGCVALTLPAGFTVIWASVSQVKRGFAWTSRVAGSGPILVTFSASTDSSILNSGFQGIFTIRVIATSSPLPAWGASAYEGTTVDSTQLGTPLSAPAPFNIKAPTGSRATSTPVPTATPVTRPTAAPTVAPTAAPTAAPRSTPPGGTPTPAPTGQPSATPAPTGQPSATPAPTGRPGATPAPGDSSAADASPSTVASAGLESSAAPSGSSAPSDSEMAVLVGAMATSGDSSGGGRGGFEATVDVGELPDGGSVKLDSQAVGVLGMFAWMVPGLFLSLPGLLLMLVVLAQGSLASIFVPITRRVFGLGRRHKSGSRPA